MANPTAQTVEGSQEEQQQQEGQVATEQATQPTQPQEEKVYAGRFKTPEELEEAYRYSSQEGIRLAQELNRLKQQLQQAQTPKQVEAIQDKIDDLTQYFDPETAKVLTGYFKGMLQKELQNFQQQSKSQSEFVSQVNEIWEETKKLYPEASDPKSKLYQRANEILFERNLAEMGTDGTVKLLTPFAYRIAVEAASMELSRQAPENAQLQIKKGQATAVQGKGSKATPTGKLTYEQYQALSDEQKDAYDQAQLRK